MKYNRLIKAVEDFSRLNLEELQNLHSSLPKETPVFRAKLEDNHLEYDDQEKADELLNPQRRKDILNTLRSELKRARTFKDFDLLESMIDKFETLVEEPQVTERFPT